MKLILVALSLFLVSCGCSHSNSETKSSESNYKNESSVLEVTRIDAGRFSDLYRYEDKQLNVVCYSISTNGIHCIPKKDLQTN